MAPVAAGEKARPTPRMPKLTYRNPLPADQLSLSSAHTSPSGTQSNNTYADQRLSTPGSTAVSSPICPSFDSRSLTSASLASNASASKDSKAPKTKKANGILGFLALKEPSQSALEQFADQQRRQTTEKGGRPSPVGLARVSPQKLPTNVPKVNSKWDGIPESVKARNLASTKSNSTASRFSSVPNGSTFSFASDGSCNPPNSLASGASSISNVPLGLSFSQSAFSQRKHSGLSVSSSAKGHMSSPSTTTLPEISYFFPDNPNPSGVVSHMSHSSLPESTPSGLSPAPSHSKQPTSFLNTALDEPSSSGSIPPPILCTPSTTEDVVDTQAIFKRLSDSQGFLAGEAEEIKLPEDDSDSAEDTECYVVEEQTPTTEHIPLPSPICEGTLRPTTMNFSRPLSTQSAPVPGISRLSVATTSYKRSRSGLPTVYEASVAESDDTIAELTNLNEPTKDNDAVSIASSVAPSEISASWYQSPRERLGLGGRIRKNDVLPWESLGELRPDSSHVESDLPTCETTLSETVAA